MPDDGSVHVYKGERAIIVYTCIAIAHELENALIPFRGHIEVTLKPEINRVPSAMDIDGETVGSMPAVLAGREESGGEFGIDHGIMAASIPRISYADLLDCGFRREVGCRSDLMSATIPD